MTDSPEDIKKRLDAMMGMMGNFGSIPTPPAAPEPPMDVSLNAPAPSAATLAQTTQNFGQPNAGPAGYDPNLGFANNVGQNFATQNVAPQPTTPQPQAFAQITPVQVPASQANRPVPAEPKFNLNQANEGQIMAYMTERLGAEWGGHYDNSDLGKLSPNGGGKAGAKGRGGDFALPA